MIVYLAGPMTGLPDKGREAFKAAEELLSKRGYTVLNPACLPDGLRPDAYMPICLAMVQAADMVCMLDGWEDSRGAQLEYFYAVYQGKKALPEIVFYEEE